MPQIYLLPLIISSTILIAGSFAQNANNYGSLGGYDLEKGPVFYEHGVEPANNYREKRYFDRGAVVEKSYQLSANSFDRPYESDRENVDSAASRNVPYYDGRLLNFELPSRRDYWSERSAPLDEKGSMDLARADYRRNLNSLNVDEKSRSARVGGVPRPEDYPVQLNRLGSSRFDEYARKIHLAAARSENQLAGGMKEPAIAVGRFFSGNEAGPDERSFYGERLPGVEGRREIEEIRRGLSRSVSGISSSSLENWGVIGEGEIPRDLKGHPAPVAYWDPQEHPRDRFQTVRSYRDRMDSLDGRSSPSEDRYSFGENIFEPRPQIINYVFSKTRAKPSANELTAEEKPRDRVKDYATRGQEKNAVHGETHGKVNKDSRSQPQVTSIQISEIPRHRTRHHHGEGSRRDYANRRRS